MSSDFQVDARSSAAKFRLRIHRGEGMALLAMDWKQGRPPRDFSGFCIEYRQPGGTAFFTLNNRIGFPDAQGKVNPATLSTRESPIQKFRWVHFPRNAELPGAFSYRVTPMFMDAQRTLAPGDPQEAALELRRETYPGQLNVTFTRGFVSSQAFVDRYASAGPISQLLPASAASGLRFEPTHPKTQEALAWMGFEARKAILDVLDEALTAQAQVSVVAYDLNEPEVVTRLEQMGSRLRIIIDDEGEHGADGSAENEAEKRLVATAGRGNVKRQHLGKLQHNKTVVVQGGALQKLVCGSTNFSWRGFYVQSNNALVLEGATAVAPFRTAFDAYFASDSVEKFDQGPSARWNDLGLTGIDARVAFSPHSASNALLGEVAADIRGHTTSSLLYSLAFLYQTEGPIKDAITAITGRNDRFVYGISDREVGGLDLQKPDGNVAPVYPAALTDNVPEPFKSEPTGGGGTRMHHKFVVIDFDQPTSRVYLGSYNFSDPADRKNGENLVLIRDRRATTSYMVEALRIFDHYHFRVAQQEASAGLRELVLHRPPAPGKPAWFDRDYTDPRRARDRQLFAGT
ncbi:MAG TPA: phospholipase D-like domain-containing protein [Myxococcaceae bacterium]|nr:phospholipase D-like domain-containing protein [Myxococcaceae bacterium]